MTALSGITVLAPAAGSGKTGVSIGLARVLADHGVAVQPFKAAAVLDIDDPAYESLPPWQCGVLHAGNAARRAVRWWHNPVVVVPDRDNREAGELFIAGERAGEVPVLGEDVLDLRSLSTRRARECLDATREALARLADLGGWVVAEGGGGAGELPPDADLANHVAPAMAGLPVLLVGNPSRSGHLTALVGLPRMLGPELSDLVAGYVLNQIRDGDHLVDVRARLVGRMDVPELGVMPYAAAPPNYDGSPEVLEWIYRRKAGHVRESGLQEWLELELLTAAEGVSGTSQQTG